MYTGCPENCSLEFIAFHSSRISEEETSCSVFSPMRRFRNIINFLIANLDHGDYKRSWPEKQRVSVCHVKD